MYFSLRSILPAVLLGWTIGFAAEPALPAAGIAGTWWEDTPEGGYYVSFLPQGDFRFYLASRKPPFELPPDLLSHGKWRLQGDTVVLSAMVHEKGTDGPPQSIGRVQLRGDTVVLTDVETGETMRGRRSTWTPDPLPSGAERKGYYETVTGTGRLELVPEKREGRPGERISIRVSLTNTDSRATFVPIRLADRVELWADPVPATAEEKAVVRFHLDRGAGPEVPPRLLAVILAPGATTAFLCTLVVPDRVGELRLEATVDGSSRVPPVTITFRVLPPTSLGR